MKYNGQTYEGEIVYGNRFCYTGFEDRMISLTFSLEHIFVVRRWEVGTVYA